MQARFKKWEEMLLSLKKKVSDGKTVVPQIIKNFEINLEFWEQVKDDPELIINNQQYQTRPDFLKYNCIALRRILELKTK